MNSQQTPQNDTHSVEGRIGVRYRNVHYRKWLAMRRLPETDFLEQFMEEVFVEAWQVDTGTPINPENLGAREMYAIIEAVRQGFSGN